MCWVLPLLALLSILSVTPAIQAQDAPQAADAEAVGGADEAAAPGDAEVAEEAEEAEDALEAGAAEGALEGGDMEGASDARLPEPGEPPKPLPGFAPGPGSQPESLPGARWNPKWRKAGFWDAMVIGTGSVLYVGESLIEIGGNGTNWDRPILWDKAVRDALRLRVPESRSTAGTLSDVMLMGSLIHSALFDNLVVAWIVHGEPELAWQMSVMNAEAYAVALSLTALVKATTSRARPREAECAADPDYSRDCAALDGNRSFFSGHSAVTAVGAGLTCAHHLNVPLYDGGLLDIGICAVGIGLTVATGALRIASDNHWATDVTAGHLVGFASGFLIPTLLYYNGHDEPDEEASDSSDSQGVRALVLPMAGPNFLGLQTVGRM